MTLVTDRLSPRGKLWCDIFVRILLVAVFSLLAWRAFVAAYTSVQLQEITQEFPYWPLWIPKFTIFLGFLLFALHSTGSFILKVINLAKPERFS
jgi:TRAP-type mannitol/chloroaromatic compound transport system permease small subunit